MKKNAFLGLALVMVVAGIGAGYISGTLVKQDPAKLGTAQWVKNYESLGQMARDVDVIVIATAQGSYPGRVVGDVPFTLTDFVVQSRLGGDIPAEFTLERTGGLTDDGTVLSIDDGGPYERGQRHLLFLTRQEESSYYILPNPQGRFGISVSDRLEAVSPGWPVAERLDGLSTTQAVRAIAQSLR